MNIIEFLMDILYYPFETNMLSYETLAEADPEMILII